MLSAIILLSGLSATLITSQPLGGVNNICSNTGIYEEYENSELGSMDRVHLKENYQIVTTQNGLLHKSEKKNLLTQEMVSKPNTIYVVGYEYELDNETIELPNNCVLEFNGGCIEGTGTIVGHHSSVEAGLYKIIGNNVVLRGTWSIPYIHASWFGLNSNDTIIDFGAAFSNIIIQTQYITQNEYWSQGYSYGGIKYKLSQGEYYNKSYVRLEDGDVLSNWTLEGYSRGSTVIINNNPNKPVFYLVSSDKESRRNWLIKDVVFRHNDAIHVFQPTRAILENCYFLGCQNAIMFEMTVNTIIKNCTFLSCQQGIRYTGSEGRGPSTTYYIEHCSFNHCKEAIHASIGHKQNKLFLDVRDSYIEYSTSYGYNLNNKLGGDNAIIVNFSNCYFEGNSDYYQRGAKTSFINCFQDKATDKPFRIIPSSIGKESFSWIGSIIPKVEGPISSINLFITEHKVGPADKRPTSLGVSNAGFQYFDTSLGKPIYWTGSKWVDALGNPL